MTITHAHPYGLHLWQYAAYALAAMPGTRFEQMHQKYEKRASLLANHQGVDQKACFHSVYQINDMTMFNNDPFWMPSRTRCIQDIRHVRRRNRPSEILCNGDS